jgi:hypothetical protein
MTETERVNDEIDSIIGRVQFDLTGDQMRGMRECDEANLRDELRQLIRERDAARKDTELLSLRLQHAARFGDEAHAECRAFREHLGIPRAYPFPVTDAQKALDDVLANTPIPDRADLR